MENVKGILTKEEGKIKNSFCKKLIRFIDINEIPKLISYLRSLKGEV